MKTPRLLLIDDDETYGQLMTMVAASRGVQLDYFPSLAATGSIGAIGQYDAAILDFFLDSFTGTEIAEYFDAFFAETPVILVSGSHENPAKAPPPKCVRRFMCKAVGPRRILDEAMTMIEA